MAKLPRLYYTQLQGTGCPRSFPEDSESPRACVPASAFTATLLRKLEPFLGFVTLTVTLGTKTQMQNVGTEVMVYLKY